MSRPWEVWQGSSLICSMEMKLTEAEARNKVENEARIGWIMEARPAPLESRRSWDPEIHEEERAGR